MTPVSLISVLVWDAPRYVENLLDNLRAIPPGAPFHLRILDQGSQPETAHLLDAFAASVSFASLERLPANIGFSAGHNHVYETTRTLLDFDYFVVLNSDVVFGEPGWLASLVEPMEADPRLAVVGPIAIADHGDHIGPADAAARASGDYLFISGCVAAIRRRAVDLHGLFDEAFTPAYWEDADLALRYRQAGWGIGTVEVRCAHGYLGDAGRTAYSKKQLLDDTYGDFRARNFDLFRARWYAGSTPPACTGEALTSIFPELYVPGCRGGQSS